MLKNSTVDRDSAPWLYLQTVNVIEFCYYLSSFGDMAHALYQIGLLRISLHASVFYCCILFFIIFILIILFELIQKCIQYINNI